ncbi:MAG: META domain-containing protein [Vicinamibacterales bacterium]
MGHPLILAAALGSLVSTAQPAVPAGAAPREFTCGAERIAVAVEGATLHLNAAGATYTLRQTPVASGVRYEADDDPSTSFWNRGDLASLRIRGRGYAECVAVDGAASADAGALAAVGHEPGWRLDIRGGQLTLVMALGQQKISVPTPYAEAFAGGRRYIASSAGRPIVATILDRPCGDAATGLPRPFTVTVEFAGQKLRGCGGETAALLDGEPWVVQDVNGAAVLRGTRPTLTFGSDGRVAGSASCNAYSAPYTVGAEGVRFGSASATGKACARAVMAQEEAFLAVLGALARLEVTADGTLVLHGDGGSRVTARRE